MHDYQKKVGRKHKISPRSERTRSQQKDRTDGVPDDQVNKVVAMMAATDPDPKELSPSERMEKMINELCTSMKEVRGQMNNIQSDIAQIKKMQTDHYEDLDTKLADCKRENESLKNKLNSATDRIDTLEQCYGRTYSLREKEKKDKKAYNLIIRGVPEGDKERLYETMNDLLAPLQGQITYTQTDGAIRMGAKTINRQGGGQKRGQVRPIKLYCATRLQKGVLYRGLPEIRKIPKFANVTMNNDLDNDSMLVRKEENTAVKIMDKIIANILY